MQVQARLDNDNTPFILLSLPAVINKAGVLLQDGGRAAVLFQYTLLSKIAATGKLVPYTDETAVDGTAIPYGIYMGCDILAADLVAGDVVDVQVLEGGAWFDKEKLVIENAKTLATVIAAATVNNRTVDDELRRLSLYSEETIEISSFEN